MNGERDFIVSADGHLLEPLDLFTTRLPEHLRERAFWEEIIEIEPWVEEGARYFRLVHTPGFEGWAVSCYHQTDGRMPTGEPERILEDMDEDGIDATMLYPNLSLFIYWTDDHELSMAHARVYNDHLIERILPYKARMRPACPIPLTDVGDAVAEIERVARAGLGAILLPAVPPVPYYSPELDPVWAAAQANRLPVFFHGFTGGVKVGEPNSEMMKQITMAGEMGTVTLDERSAANRSNASQSMKGAPIVTDLVSGGVPERFPELHFNLIEFNANWLTRLMGGMDKAWTTGIGQDKDFWGGYWDSSRPASDQPKMARIFNVNSKWPHPLKPSEYIKRQFHVSFQDDPAAVGCRSYTGISTLVWGNDYPHAEGTFRGSRELIPELFAGVPDDERAAILGGTMAEVVGFDRAAAVRHAVTPRDN